MSLSVLQNIGLSDTEGFLYELLLKLGEVPVVTLINESHLKRPTVYKALGTLERKGLVTSRDIKKKIHYMPVSPTKLTEIVDKEFEEMRNARENLQSILPSLALNYTLSTEKPVVRTYEGIDGLKQIYNGLLEDKKPISAILQAATVDPELYEWLTTKFVKKRVRERIHVRAIVASSSKSKEYIEKSPEEFRTSKMVDSELFPFEHEIDIYGDKVAIINYKKDEPLIGIVIHHEAIARTMKAWFNLAWAQSQKDE